MAYQKGFYGVGYAGEDTGSTGLVKALGSMSKSMEKYGEYLGTEQDKKVLADAEKAARIDNFKSYQSAVDSGEIENTKSQFWIAAYDNIKGKNEGATFITKKQLAYQDWIANESNSGNLDLDGSRYLNWSQEFNKNELKNIGNQSSYFMKGLDPLIGQADQTISAAYASHNATRAKESGKNEYGLYINSIFADNSLTFKDKMAKIDSEDSNAEQFRLLDRKSRDAITIQEVKNYIADNLDPSDINSDYDGAINFVRKFQKYSRTNGSKYLKDNDVVEFDQLVDTLEKERDVFNKNLIEQTQGVELDAFVDGQKATLMNVFFDTKMNKSRDKYKNGRSIGQRATNEYDARLRHWLINNPEADLKQKMEYSESLRMDLTTKHKGQKLYQIGIFDKEDLRGGKRPGSSLNIRGMTRDLTESLNEYSLTRDELNINRVVANLSDEEKTKTFQVEYNGKMVSAQLGVDLDGVIDPNSNEVMLLFKDDKGRTLKTEMIPILDEDEQLEVRNEMDSTLISSMARLNGFDNPDDFLVAYEEFEQENRKADLADLGGN